MRESELSQSLKFALFLLGLFSVLPLIIGTVMIFFCVLGFISYQEKVVSSNGVQLLDYLRHFAYFGMGIGFYLTGRIINFIGSVVKEINLQQFDQTRLIEKLCLIAQEVCFITIIAGVTTISLGLIDNLVRSRPFSYYTVLIIWLVIILLCMVANKFLKKHITSEIGQFREPLP